MPPGNRDAGSSRDESHHCFSDQLQKLISALERPSFVSTGDPSSRPGPDCSRGSSGGHGGKIHNNGPIQRSPGDDGGFTARSFPPNVGDRTGNPTQSVADRIGGHQVHQGCAHTFAVGSSLTGSACQYLESNSGSKNRNKSSTGPNQASSGGHNLRRGYGDGYGILPTVEELESGKGMQETRFKPYRGFPDQSSQWGPGYDTGSCREQKLPLGYGGDGFGLMPGVDGEDDYDKYRDYGWGFPDDIDSGCDKQEVGGEGHDEDGMDNGVETVDFHDVRANELYEIDDHDGCFGGGDNDGGCHDDVFDGGCDEYYDIDDDGGCYDYDDGY